MCGKLSHVWLSFFSGIEICDDANQTSLLTIKNNHIVREFELYIIVTQVPFFLMAQQPPVGQELLTVVVYRSHSDTPHSVGLLWTSDQLDAETCTWQHTTLTTDRYQCPSGIRTHSLSRLLAADPRLRPCVLCVVRQRSLRGADLSCRGVLPRVVCLSVIMNPRYGGRLGPLGAVAP